jgi:C1A family cysteine protease
MRGSKHKYGWQPDISDERDFLYGAIRPMTRLPKKVDLRARYSKVEYQGGLGSCTAQSLAVDLEFLDNKTDGQCTDVSRFFIHYNERLLTGSVNYDSGASLRVGMKTLKKDGACEEKPWPYVMGRFGRKPLQKCHTDADEHRITSYHCISGLKEMLVCFAEGLPVRIWTYRPWEF